MGTGRVLRAILLTAGAVAPLGGATVWMACAPGATVSAAGAATEDGPREVAVHVHAWGFSPRVVHLAPGQTVRFVALSEDISHGFAINELGVNLQLRPGQEVRSPVVAMTPPRGDLHEFTATCSVGWGHKWMVAKDAFVVRP